MRFVYKLGLRRHYRDVDRLHYLKRLARARGGADERYVSGSDRSQYAGGDLLVIERFGGAEVLFFVDPENHTERGILRDGFSSGVLAHMAAHARPGAAVVDVGANVGAYCVPLARSRPDVEVHAFEPHPLALERLRRNASLNELGNLVVHERAAGETPGAATLHGYGLRDLGLSTLRAPARGAEARYPVTVVRLDDELAATERVSVLKIDVEGHELAVLRGARGLIARARPRLVLEHADRILGTPEAARAGKQALAALLQELDYAAFYISRYDSRLLFPVRWDRPLNGDLLALPAAERDAR